MPRSVDEARAKAWRGAARLLRSDVVLRTLNPLWQTPDPDLCTPGTSYGDDPPDNRWTIRLTPRMGTLNRLAFCGHGRTLYEAPVRLEIAVTPPVGPDATRAMEVWSQIEDALTGRWNATARTRSQDVEVRSFWDQLASDFDIADIELETPGDTPDDGGTGVGAVVITCHVEG